MLESWYRDFVLGLRALRRSPVFCLTAVLTLAIGIGANTAVFTLLHGLLLRGLPVEEPQQLVRINLVSAEFTTPGTRLPYRMVQHLRGGTQSLTDISSWEMSTVPIEDREGTLRQYQVGLVGGASFELMGMRPYFGRLLASSDDVRGGPADGWPVVLSYGFWRERMGGDREVVGKTIKVSGAIVTVVGVAPPNFHGVWPGFEPKLYFPFQFSTVLAGPANQDNLNSPEAFVFCNAIGRLKPGVSAGEAHAEISAREKELLNEFVPARFKSLPFFRTARLTVESARTGFPTFFGRTYSTPLYLMQGLVAVVLLLCCLNVSGLMMSKIYQRQHEFAVRTAMGAARWRLIRQYLTESFAIAVAGAGLAAVVTWHGSGLLLQFFRHPNMGIGMSLEPDRTVFLVTAVFAVLTTLFFGILPAWRAGRSDPSILLKSRTSAGRRQTVGRAFIPIQVSLSLVLVTLATLLSQSLVRIRGEHTGFDVDHVTIQTPPFHRLPQQGDAKLDLYQRMVDRIEQSPGIQSAAVTWFTPMTGTQLTAGFQAIAEGPNPPEDPGMAYNHVGPGYFRTMKTTIVAGREFEKNQRAPDVCVLNQAAANHLFPHQSALGQYVRSNDEKRFPKPISCPRGRRRRGCEVRQPARTAAPHHLFPGVERAIECESGVSDELADQGASRRRIP